MAIHYWQPYLLVLYGSFLLAGGYGSCEYNYAVAFSALKMLVRSQEGHLACKACHKIPKGTGTLWKDRTQSGVMPKNNAEKMEHSNSNMQHLCTELENVVKR